jgi:CHAT domain-containing protein/tetratricopeptide (TPR) repeat protein
MQSLRLVRGMQRNRLFAMRPRATLSEVRIRLAAVIGLVSLGLCATGSAQTRDAQSALAEAQRLEGAGNPAAALESYRWALDASRPESPERATALLGMAAVETGQGKYADARRHAADASRRFDRLGDPVHASLSLNRQGRAAVNAGDYDEAGELFAAALERSTKAGYLEGRTEQLGNLANVQFYLGRYADAGRLNVEAIALTSSASSSEPWVARRRWVLLANQATLFQRLGRDQEALATYRELGTSSELRPRERAQMLVNLGVLYRHLGDPVKALSTYDEAGKLFARDQDVDGELNTVKNRGIVLALDLGRLDEAERSFTSALETATRLGNRRELLHDQLYRGETLLRSGNHERARDDFAAALILARELRTPEEEWKALYGLGRVAADHAGAIAYFEEAVATIETVREAIRVPSLRAEFLNDKREVYDALIAATLPATSPDTLFALLERSHSRVWRERLQLDKPIALAQVQRSLPDDTLLLDYWNSPRGSAVIAVSRQRAAVFPIGVDEAQIRTFIQTLAAGRSATWRAQSAAVGTRLLPPDDWLAGISRIVVVPDGVIALVPVEVVTQGNQLIVERAAVTYSPTAATLLRSAAPPRWLPPWRLQIRAFADPVTGSNDLDGSAVGRLPASAEEARVVASELGGRALLHLGQDNRKAYLSSPAERAPLLHLATHAVADTTAMERSHILFSPSDRSGSNPDYLFLKEVYALNLKGVELAVLSACDTESGRLVRGEGVESFSRAFLAAGAQSTVTTMWRVADEPTADFMEVFYHFLGRGEPRDQALRHAKLRFLENKSDLSDPHYWAAFLLTGDGFEPVPRAVTWQMVAGALVVISIAGVFAVRMYRRTKSVPA